MEWVGKVPEKVVGTELGRIRLYAGKRDVCLKVTFGNAPEQSESGGGPFSYAISRVMNYKTVRVS